MFAALRQALATEPPTNAKTQAILDAEVLWLCKSGMVQKIYAEEPDFNARSLRMEKLCTWRIKRQHPDDEVIFVSHCHAHIVSLALQMWRHAWDRVPAADQTIPLRLAHDEALPDERKRPPR